MTGHNICCEEDLWIRLNLQQFRLVLLIFKVSELIHNITKLWKTSKNTIPPIAVSSHLDDVSDSTYSICEIFAQILSNNCKELILYYFE